MKKFWIWLRCGLLGHSKVRDYRDLENHPAWMYLWTCTRCGRRLATSRLYGCSLSEGVTRPGTVSVDADTETYLINKWSKEI